MIYLLLLLHDVDVDERTDHNRYFLLVFNRKRKQNRKWNERKSGGQPMVSQYCYIAVVLDFTGPATGSLCDQNLHSFFSPSVLGFIPSY